MPSAADVVERSARPTVRRRCAATSVHGGPREEAVRQAFHSLGAGVSWASLCLAETNPIQKPGFLAGRERYIHPPQPRRDLFGLDGLMLGELPGSADRHSIVCQGCVCAVAVLGERQAMPDVDSWI